MKKLSVHDVYKKCNLSSNGMNFKTTNDVEPLQEELLSQKKAKDILDFGLSIDRYGYNIFLSGEQSSRRETYLRKVLNKKATDKAIPDDICYIHNFKEERKPILIQLPAGLGKSFKKDMDEFIDKIKSEFEVLFNEKKYKKECETIEQKFDELAEASLQKYKDIAKNKCNHILELSPDGQIYITPINCNQEPLNQEQFDNLSNKAKNYYKNMKNKVGMIIIEMMDEQDRLQKLRDKELKEIDKKNAILKIDNLISNIINKYSSNEKIKLYTDNLKEDLLKNIDVFKPSNNTQPTDIMGGAFLLDNSENNINEITKKYSVNLIIDNSELKSAPVVFAKNSYEGASLFGTSAIFVDSKGIMTTDFTHIHSGDLLRANGGFLVINSEYLSEELWYDLKNVLKTKKLEISSKYYKSDITLSDALKPEPIDINLKIILLGDYNTYNALSLYDDTFSELFGIHSSFESEMDRNPENELDYLKFISKYCRESNIMHLTYDAVEKLIEYSSRVAEHQNKISLSYKSLYSILNEADLWAKRSNKNVIDLEIIEKTLDYKNYIKDNYTKYTEESFKNKVILLDVNGEKVGQINGLTVFSLGDYSLGEPAKITANTFKGKSSIISIERDIDMSGPTHNKGVNILSGFLNEILSNKKPLPLSTTLTFEQNYGGIDGDSATVAEVCAVLSSMSGIPINQSFAITGSMNQKGDVQAIGGVNEKIEGFYKVCKTLNPSGRNSVIIPKSNIQNLMLNKDVLNGLEQGSFEIYAIDRVEDAVKLLLNKSLDEVIDTIKSRHKC
ncbi:MAG: AAA family ATPase [Romboutsia sp.]|nr:AAA family ATPase [Romboutsia sp.]